MKFLSAFILLFFFSASFSQKTTTVKNIKGSALVVDDVSPNMAKAKALNEAKTNALKAAGVGEHISAYEMLFTSTSSKDYSQFFSSDIQSEMQGAIGSYTVVSENLQCQSQFTVAESKKIGNMKEVIVCDVVIDAEVIKYETRSDPSFNAGIEGVKAAYNNGENLKFSIKPSQNCYMTLFNITDTDASLLIPNSYEKNNKLAKLETASFPRAKVDYSLGSETKKPETNRFIFVFTKTEIPFVKTGKEGRCSSEDIFSWIYSIPPDQRRVEYFTASISK